MQTLSIGSMHIRDEIKPDGARKAHRKIEEAAGQFEALMIGQLLESMTKTGLPNEDSSGSSVLEMGKDQLAQAISNGGGLGLKKTIMNSFDRENRTPT